MALYNFIAHGGSGDPVVRNTSQTKVCGDNREKARGSSYYFTENKGLEDASGKSYGDKGREGENRILAKTS